MKESNQKENMDALSVLIFDLLGNEKEEKFPEEAQEEVETVDFRDMMVHMSIGVLFGRFTPVTREAFEEGTIIFLVMDKEAKEMKFKMWKNFELTDYKLTDEDTEAEDWILL